MSQLSQRQDFRTTRWKAPGDLFNPREFEVASIDTDSEPRAFVETHHYAASYVAAAHRFGLYSRRGKLQGVAVFSTGVNDRTITNVFGDQLVPWQEAFELGRFVLRDAVPYNAETWFLARCLDVLRHDGVRGVVSFSDPYPRRRKDGSYAFVGHWGQIYQASNAVYTGRGTGRTLRLLPDGSVLNDRTMQKIRRQERGWASAVERLVDAGAPPLSGRPVDWLNERVLPAITRTIRHPGNHRYVFALGRRGKPRILATEATRPLATDLEFASEG